MIEALLIALAASPQSCDALNGKAHFRCQLEQSIAAVPEADCKERMTQFDMNVCSYRDGLRREIELTESWDQVKVRWGESELFATILAAQRSWLTYRDKQCAIWAEKYEGGTIVPLMVNSCKNALTKARIAELNKLLQER